MLPAIQLPALAAAAGLFCWAGASDLRRYRIPNAASLALVAAFGLFTLGAWGAGLSWSGHLTVGALALAIGIAAFSCNLTGGGDGKLFAALALWAGPERILAAVLLMGLVGGVLALAQLLTLQQARARAAGGGLLSVGLPSRADLRRAPVPYGVAISIAGLYALWGLAAPLL
ncbi:prepilin peptidase CpaA [Tistlia consotensis]|uniref:Prepilin peptidase CpaA n=1 Tax=Tistlia consotensis USBA 355 TaxID=560819 RepID=A0A1Y6BI75_9PROT|nr:prepilin peptidase [Tistlia consotensis]SMF12652.1 prepilin peptidase CpaA [Tistlia consotensis USBA 355]SNR50968.1 prepilin peptidase CpaA [Tistlia consotensis]